MTTSFDALHAQIAELFKQAEQKIKLVENYCEGVTFPAVNQLRYVGFHLLRAYQTPDNEKKEEDFRKALNHCQRANYDAIEPGIIYLLEKFKIFIEDYKDETITDVLPEYINYREQARTIKEVMASVAHDSIDDRFNHENNRAYEHKEFVEHFDQLREIYGKLEFAREELNKKRKKDRRNIFYLACGILVTLLGILVNM